MYSECGNISWPSGVQVVAAQTPRGGPTWVRQAVKNKVGINHHIFHSRNMAVCFITLRARRSPYSILPLSPSTELGQLARIVADCTLGCSLAGMNSLV